MTEIPLNQMYLLKDKPAFCVKGNSPYLGFLANQPIILSVDL